MGLFGKRKDVDFFKNINKELIVKLIDQWIYIYNVVAEQSENIYGERVNKSYEGPYRISALVDRSGTSYVNEVKGIDTTREIDVQILRESLVGLDTTIRMNDIVLWDNEYYEIFFLDENQNIFGKDNNNDLSPESNTGSNFAVHFKATKVNKINLE